MPKQKEQLVKVLDIVATTIAAVRFQQEACDDTLPFSVDASSYKPTQGAYIGYPVKIEGAEDEQRALHLCAVSDVVKKTLGVGYPSEEAYEVVATDDDRVQAQEALDRITNHVLMQTLKGNKLNDFLANMVASIEQDEVPARNIGLLTYVARTAKQFKEQEAVEVAKADFMTSRVIGPNGMKVELNVTILVKRYIRSWDKFVIEANDEAGNLITFFKDEKHVINLNVGDTISIVGKIKTAGPSQYSNNQVVNTLNYVKIAK
jgi:hypothetical protein